MKEIYVSTDIEADGPIPGPHSMLSFGSVAILEDKTVVSSFSANLETLPGATGDKNTMEWWAKNQAAWEETRKGTVDPKQAMVSYVNWVKSLPGKPVFVGYPAGFDFLFMYWYLIKFAGESPFSFSALDIKTYASCVLNIPYRDAVKSAYPSRWFDSKFKHTHKALDDAMEQGMMFIQMLRERRSKTLHDP